MPLTKTQRKHQALLNTLMENMTTVDVKLGAHTAAYTYKVPKDWGVKVGDTLVVDSPRTSGLLAVTVVEVHKQPKLDADSEFFYKWAVQKVDRTAYDAQLAREQLFLEQLAEVERVHQKAKVLSDATSALGVDTEAGKAFQEAVAALTGEPVQLAKADGAEATTAS